MNSDPEISSTTTSEQAESQAIAREFFGGYGSGSMADDAIGRIAEIGKLGGAGVLTDGGPEIRLKLSDMTQIQSMEAPKS